MCITLAITKYMKVRRWVKIHSSAIASVGSGWYCYYRWYWSRAISSWWRQLRHFSHDYRGLIEMTFLAASLSLLCLVTWLIVKAR